MSRRVPEANLERPRTALTPHVPLGLKSHLGPVRHEYSIAPSIIETHKPYHDDNVGTQSAGRLTLSE